VNAREENLPSIRETAEGYYVVEGELTFNTVPRAWQASRALLDEARKSIRLDLRHVNHADSAALAYLVEWFREARRQNIEFLILNMPEQLRSVARVTGMERLLPTATGNDDEPDKSPSSP
jgi:phospholipid transport system transporter-binding protein